VSIDQLRNSELFDIIRIMPSKSRRFQFPNATAVIYNCTKDYQLMLSALSIMVEPLVVFATAGVFCSSISGQRPFTLIGFCRSQAVFKDCIFSHI